MYTRSPDYLYCRNGIFYFTRNVPSDFKTRFNKSRVVVSLHTRSIIRAQKSASALSDRLDRYFESLRLERFHSQELGLKFDTNMVTDSDEPEVTITDALDLYVRLKGTGRGKVFARTAERNANYLIECVGKTSLSDIKPTDAGKFRDHLIAKALSPSSVKRVMTSVKAIYNLGAKELGVTNPNPFTGIFIPDNGTVIERLPVPLDVIRTIQDECFEIDDDNRWLVAMIADTGMRLIIRANDKSEKGCASFWGNLSKSELDTIMRVPKVSWVTLSLRIATTTVHSRVSQLSQVIIKL